MFEDEIHVAYDRKNGKYVAYNVENNIFATGVCVESACDAYRSRYYEIQADMARQDYEESLLP
jgi:phosphoribosylaminoimidazole carboxylase (NCAIR synthetase)